MGYIEIYSLIILLQAFGIPWVAKGPASQVFELVYFWSDYLNHFVGAFPIRTERSNTRLLGVLEDFSQD